MEKELLEQFQKLADKIDGVETRLTERMATKEDIKTLSDRIGGVETRMDGLDTRMDGMQSQMNDMQSELSSVKGIVLGLENNLTARLESLFDGYHLTHEKQWELERKVEQMEKRLELLEMKAI